MIILRGQSIRLLFMVSVYTWVFPAEAGGGDRVVPEVIERLQHDSRAFTQGFLYHNRKLYESTGLRGRSSIRVLDPDNGSVVFKKKVPDVFCEGLALMDNRLVQLTWKSGRALIYDTECERLPNEFSYSGEGWGLTSADGLYVMSNGSDTLYFRDKGFNVVHKLQVKHSGRPLKKLNELEYARGLVFCNVWYDNAIYAVNPQTGETEFFVDCSELVQAAGIKDRDNVLNGIAWDSSEDVFYLTGKHWPVIFKVRIEE